MILPWTALQPSTIERRWQAAAAIVATVACTVLIVASLVREPRYAALAWSAIVAGVIATLVSIVRNRPARSLELSINDDGAVQVRSVDSAATGYGRPMRAIFGAPWLISLSDGTISCSVWPDSLPADAFRRLWVCVRWGRASRTAAPGPDEPGHRTFTGSQ